MAEAFSNVGPMLLTHWGFEQELITAASHAENWQRAVPKVDCCDLVQVAQLQCEMMDSKLLTDVPSLEELPAFERLNFDQINPKLLIAQARQDIREVIHFLE